MKLRVSGVCLYEVFRELGQSFFKRPGRLDSRPGQDVFPVHRPPVQIDTPGYTLGSKEFSDLS